MPHVPHQTEHAGLGHVLWAACASVVVMFIFLAALGAFEPGEVVELTIVVIGLAALLLAHEWRGLFREERR
jgi:xanthine/uracil permease